MSESKPSVQQAALSMIDKVMPVLTANASNSIAGRAYAEARSHVRTEFTRFLQGADDQEAEREAYGRELEMADAKKTEAENTTARLKEQLKQQRMQGVLRGHVIALITQYLGEALTPCNHASTDVYHDMYEFTYELDDDGLHVTHSTHLGRRSIKLTADPSAPIEAAEWDRLTGFLINCLRANGSMLDNLPLIMPEYLVLQMEQTNAEVFLAASQAADESIERDRVLYESLYRNSEGR